MSSFLVSQDCLDLGLRAGAFVLEGIQVAPASQELRSKIDDEVQRIRSQFAGPAEIRSMAELVKLHEILRGVGVRPRSHPPSTQKLLESAWQRGEIPEVNNLVDAYNLASMITRCSLGAHDLDHLALPVELRLFRGSENFRPLGSEEDQPVNRGEFGYVDAEARVICRLDSLQADFSKVTNRTTRALLIIESTSVHDAERLEEDFAVTREVLDRFCDVKAEVVAFPG
jgi:DNA/RNA-binding domain of Phe-tRNA-synthetase-like protein